MSAADTGRRDRSPGLPRLLAGISARGALGLPEHLALHGQLPDAGRRYRGSGEHELIEQLEHAGLRGRGGGGFPSAAKLRAVAGARRSALGGRPIVVVNAAEGEPASAKDRTLLQALPHLVLDGAALVARAVGAEEILICICESASDASASVAGALAERGKLEPRGAARMRPVAVPDRYVAGQESALINYLNGGPALPTFVPPLPSERGVRRRPTLVNNAETLAHVALIARHGPQWFRAIGTAAQPGSALVTLWGPFPDAGVYEIEYGSSLSALLEAAGGAQRELRALLVGGYAGTWIDGPLLHGVALSDEHLAPYGAALGAGVLVALSVDACPVAELARVTRWLATQSAGQCGPCVFGLDALASTVEQVAQGAAPAHAERRLAELAALVRRRGACGHPDGVSGLVTSALEVFAEELADHARHGPCNGCERHAELPRPRSRSHAARSRATGRDADLLSGIAGR